MRILIRDFHEKNRHEALTVTRADVVDMSPHGKGGCGREITNHSVRTVNAKLAEPSDTATIIAIKKLSIG